MAKRKRAKKASYCPAPPPVNTDPVGTDYSVTIPNIPAAASGLVLLCKPGSRKPGCARLTAPSERRPNPPGYAYTQPDAIRASLGDRTPTSKERAAYGCLKKPSGRGYTGENAFGVVDPFCGGKALSFPCGSDRFAERSPTKCPVQLVWKDGQRHLRFCFAHKKAGRLLPVDSPADALKTATAACKHWKKNLSWDGYAPLEGAQLGGTRKRKKRRRKKRSA